MLLHKPYVKPHLNHYPDGVYTICCCYFYFVLVILKNASKIIELGHIEIVDIALRSSKLY